MTANIFVRRKRAYQQLFGHEPAGIARAVLADLKRFSRLPDPPVVKDAYGRVDPIASAILVGRQEVVNRILAQINVADRDLFNLKEDPDE